MDSKLDFISKMSFAIRQKFQVISCDAETFLNQLKQHQQQGPQQEQGPTDNLREMVAHMVDVMEACNNCTTVLQDFSVCEKIINGDTRGTSRPTPIFPLIKDFLTNFYVEHVRYCSPCCISVVLQRLCAFLERYQSPNI